MSKRRCVRCGKDPAEGFARRVWTQETGEQFYCHDDDDVSCYESQAVAKAFGEAVRRHRVAFERPRPHD